MKTCTKNQYNYKTTEKFSICSKLVAAIVVLFLSAVGTPAGAGEIDVEKKINHWVQIYIEGAAEPQIEADAPDSAHLQSNASDGQLIVEGKWLDLAKKYDNRYVSGDIANAPSPQRLAQWWNSLGDEDLTELVHLCLQNNRDLAAARARLTEARAALGIGKANLLPWLDSVNTWTNTDTSKNSTSAGGSANIYRLGVDASWEIDVFGGQRENIKASEASLLATHAELHSAWVSLSSEVALNYLSLRTLQQRLNIAGQNLDLQMDTLEMLQSQFDSGLADALALNQAKYTVEQTKATIPPLRASIETAMNALAILTGVAPGSLEEKLSKPMPIPQADPVNLVGIPAETIRRRPDIRSAEMQLLAQTARKKSAKADLYPKFHLVGSIGIESLSTGSLFSSDSYGFSIGPKISWPIFHGGAIRKNIQVQGAREEQLLAAYEGTVLNAVAEVRDALANEVQERERNQSLQRGVEAARAAVQVAEDKYRNGLIDFNNVIGAQTALLSLQDQHVISEGQMTTNIVQVFKVLGGGWAPLDEELLAAAVNSK